MLRSFGRSGSTMLMQLLGSSDEISFHRKTPYEERYLSYFARLSALTAMPPDNSDGWGHEAVNSGVLTRLGPIPYNGDEYFSREKFQIDVFKALWAAFSLRIKETEPEANFYAEKVSPVIAEVVNKNCYSKNIFLIRDPRDEFLSIVSFNKKRQRNAFGWRKDDTEKTFARRLCSQRIARLNFLARFEQEDRKYLIQYENLILDPYVEVKKLSEWLGVELNWDSLIAQKEAHLSHMTSATPEDSVMRWKSEMSDDIKEIFSCELGSALNALGYEV